ncbi:hypothetical protein FRC16_007847 [Serendipita sp. 398]|nr:hypothetical protein FRC16_007847 [Serendipita sp. 398]
MHSPQPTRTRFHSKLRPDHDFLYAPLTRSFVFHDFLSPFSPPVRTTPTVTIPPSPNENSKKSKRHAPAIMAIEKFTIIVSGERFVLTRDQLESDPGNYFAEYFLIGFKDVPFGTRELEIEKEPLLFKLIQAHLRGYNILPLPDQWIPPYMTKEGALDNLMKEAQFYGLWNLQNRIEEYQSKAPKSSSRPGIRSYKLAQYKQSGWVYCDLSESGFKALLQRFISTPGLQPLAPSSLSYEDYTLVACWRDFQHEESASGFGLPRLCICALLESDP